MQKRTTSAEGANESAKTIAEMSALHGVSLRTLRFYEDKGLLAPTRVHTQRFYSAKDETRLQIILKGKRLGFTLSEVAHLILSHSDKDRDVLQVRVASDDGATMALPHELVKQQIEKLERMLDTTNEAIAELTARIREMESDPERCPVGTSPVRSR